jgi:tetratricopeptide (TPR) repeat protein
VRRLSALGLAASLVSAQGCVTTPAPGPAPSARQRVQLLLEKEPAAALRLADELAAAAPADLELARLRAEAWVRAGRGGELVNATAPGTPAGHYTRGLALYARAADVPRALEEFRAAAALAPGEPELHHRLGVALLEAEDEAAALPSLQRALELAPGRAAWRLPLAKALHRTGRSTDAVEALRSFVELGPAPRDVQLARDLMARISPPLAGVPRAALPKLEQALHWLNTADAPQQAAVALEELLLEYPDLGPAHALLGLAFQRLEDAGRAVEEFRRAAELQPLDGRPHYYLAVLLLGRQKDPSAREALERALERDPLIDDAWGRLGDLALGRGETATARRCYRVLTALQPNAPLAHSRYALVLQLDGDFAAAEAELRRAHELAPADADLQLRLGLLFSERRKQARTAIERASHAAEAERWIRQVLESQPDNAAAAQALDQLRAP